MTHTPSRTFSIRPSIRPTERLNPVLVRHVRQQLRSRAFVFVYTLLLVIGVATSLATASNLSDRPTAGLELAGLLAGVWSLSAWLYLPLAAFAGVSHERDAATWDLLRLTGTRPFSVVAGHLQSAGVANIVYASALAPFMVMAFLLRGVDLLTIGFLTVAIPLISLILASGGVFFACFGANRALRTLLGVLLALLAAGTWLVMLELWVDLDRLQGMLASLGEVAVPALVGLAAMGLYATFLPAVAGANLLLPPTHDRSSGPRMAIYLGFFVILGATVGVWYDSLDWGLASFGGVGGAGAGLLGIFSVTEDWQLSRRQRQRLAAMRWWRLPAIFGPGAARGRLAFLVLAFLAAGVAYAPVILSTLDPTATDVGGWTSYSLYGPDLFDVRTANARVAWQMGCYGAIIFVAVDLLAWGPLKRQLVTATARRLAVLGVIAAGTVLAVVIPALSQDPNHGARLLSPFTGLWAINRELRQYASAGEPLSIVGGSAMAVLFLQALARWRVPAPPGLDSGGRPVAT